MMLAIAAVLAASMAALAGAAHAETATQETVLSMVIPDDNTSPWGAVRGGPAENAAGHPVVIQFHKDGEMVHVAQVEAAGDGSYEYVFRVRSTDLETGGTVDIYSGQYTVKVYRTVPVHGERA